MRKFVLFVLLAVLAFSTCAVFADEPVEQEAEDKIIKKDTAGNPVDL